jgi:hypothetical protein
MSFPTPPPPEEESQRNQIWRTRGPGNARTQLLVLSLWRQFSTLLLLCWCLSRQGVSRSLVSRRGAPFPGLFVLQIWLLLDFSFWGFVKDNIYREKSAKCMSCVTESSELKCVLPMKHLPAPVEKLNIVLMCVVPLMVPILRSAENIRNCVRSSV